MKRRIMKYLTIALICSFMAFYSGTIIANASNLPTAYLIETRRKPTIEYRYKLENGKLYRRLYNYAEQCWVGEWEWCP